MHIANQLTILSIILLLVLIKPTLSDIIFTSSNKMKCQEFEQLIIIKRPITINQNYLTIKGMVKLTDGSIAMKIIPIYQGMVSVDNKTLLNSFNVDYTSFNPNNYNGIIDMEQLFRYKQEQIVNINNIKGNKKLTEIIILYKRLSKAHINLYFNRFSCQQLKVQTILSTSSAILPVSCKSPGSILYQINNNRCKCHKNYYLPDCSTFITSLSVLRTNSTQINSFQSHYYYYTPNSRDNLKVKFHLYSLNASILGVTVSIQPLQIYPYITVANYFNRALQPFGQFVISSKQSLLITIKNHSPYILNYYMQLDVEPINTWIQIIIIAVASFLGILILVVISFCIYCNLYVSQTSKIKNIKTQMKHADIFPTITYLSFKRKVMSEEQQDYYEERLCSICLEQIVNNSQIKYTFCNHILDAKCLETWMQKQQNCPNCRQSFKDQNVKSWQQKISMKAKQIQQKMILTKKKNKGRRKRKRKVIAQNQQKRERRASTDMGKIQLDRFNHNETLQQLGENNKKNFTLGEVIIDNHRKVHADFIGQQPSQIWTLAQSQNRHQQQKQDIYEEVYKFYKQIWYYHYHHLLQNNNLQQVNLQSQTKKLNPCQINKSKEQQLDMVQKNELIFKIEDSPGQVQALQNKQTVKLQQFIFKSQLIQFQSIFQPQNLDI